MSKKEWLELIVSIFERLRPKFYNKLTWFVVSIGAALAASPIWWQAIINNILASLMNTTIESDVSPWVGVVVIAMGLIYHVIVDKLVYLKVRQESTENQDYDAAIYKAFKAQMDECWSKDTIKYLADYHAYYSTDFEKVRENIATLSSPEHHFISEELQKCSKKLVNDFQSLFKFILNEFDMYPYDQIGENCRVLLRPEWKCDLKGNPDNYKNYHKLAVQLIGLIEAYEASYDELIKSAHKNLKTRILS